MITVHPPTHYQFLRLAPSTLAGVRYSLDPEGKNNGSWSESITRFPQLCDIPKSYNFCLLGQKCRKLAILNISKIYLLSCRQCKCFNLLDIRPTMKMDTKHFCRKNCHVFFFCGEATIFKNSGTFSCAHFPPFFCEQAHSGRTF